MQCFIWKINIYVNMIFIYNIVFNFKITLEDIESRNHQVYYWKSVKLFIIASISTLFMVSTKNQCRYQIIELSYKLYCL